MIALTAVAAFILNKTPYGRSITAAGGNEKAAVMCGIKVARMRMISYVVMGLLSAFTGVLPVSYTHLAPADPQRAHTADEGPALRRGLYLRPRH